jgi:hypothetical protein
MEEDMDGALKKFLGSFTRGDLERTRDACEREGDSELAGLLTIEIDRRRQIHNWFRRTDGLTVAAA